ncbi:MAG: hypothetical protein HYU27_05260 [Acidobacteria bacterium]|nr:hypothetical protein [Acidobacteriota bacterium]
MASFPRERILVEADVYNPGAAVTPFAPSLLENITKRNLRVDRIVPLHAAIAPYSELVKTVRTATNRSPRRVRTRRESHVRRRTGADLREARA